MKMKDMEGRRHNGEGPPGTATLSNSLPLNLLMQKRRATTPKQRWGQETLHASVVAAKITPLERASSAQNKVGRRVGHAQTRDGRAVQDVRDSGGPCHRGVALRTRCPRQNSATG